ncbi:hypothetical protein, partial [Endozoicomonas sp. SESOKO2]|uniref:hypothetical protein n=1 Tax=Endozoicomonas sp. SESOKO2 TaxID=2828743 RepID=UPI00214948B5
ANPEKAKRTVNAARQPKDLKPGIRVSNEVFNKIIHAQHLFQLDNNIIKEVRLIQANPEKFLQQVEKQISAFKKAVVKNKNPTNELGLGYYYFLKALAMMRAKMSDDDKTIELSFSPQVMFNAKKIKETILHSENFYFPYARMLLLFFEYATKGELLVTLSACASAFSGVSQSIEILLESESHSAVLTGVLLKWLLLIPKPFELKLAFEADTYLKNPQSKIPGRVTPSIRLLREFLEQLPAKGSDGAVDLILARIDETFINPLYLPYEQHEHAEAIAAVLAAVETASVKAQKAKQVIAEIRVQTQEHAKAVDELNTASIALAKAKTVAEKFEKVEARESLEAIKEEEVKVKGGNTAETQAEVKLRLVLSLATGRMDLLKFYSLDLSPIIMRFSLQDFIAPSSLNAIFLKEKKEQLTKDIDPENRALADIIKLAFHLLDVSPEEKPVFPHLKALPLNDQASLTVHHFGHDLQFLTKLISLFPELATKDESQWYNVFFLIHEYTIRRIGENPEKAKTLQSHSEDWQKKRNWFEKHIWHMPVETDDSHLIPKDIDSAFFDSASLKKFKDGDEGIFILAIQQARKVGYQKLMQQLKQYENKLDDESLQMTGWINCLAGLTLLEAEISSDSRRIVLTDRKSFLESAYEHFMKARITGFHYGGYLESLVFMRLANHYQYYQDETSAPQQKDSIYKPVIQYVSTKKPEEKLFIEAGKIITEILPGLIASSMCGVRFAAEAAIRIFTNERFNLLHIPQAGWPTILTKYFLLANTNYHIQFVFSNDGSEAEKELFPKINNPDSIERILLKPLEEIRKLSIKERPEQYGIFLDSEIKSSGRPENIKKYLSLVKAFIIGKPEVLDISSEVRASDIDQLSENITSYELSRSDFITSFEALQETPQTQTGFDEFIYNLPQLESHPNYGAISNALLKKHRTKSALIHYYLWAYETLDESCDNERNLFWDTVMAEKIEKNEQMKTAFFTLLATADLTVMYDDNREAMSTAFKQYDRDLSVWLAFFHSISANSARLLGEKHNADFHMKHLLKQKKILSR